MRKEISFLRLDCRRHRKQSGQSIAIGRLLYGIGCSMWFDMPADGNIPIWLSNTNQKMIQLRPQLTGLSRVPLVCQDSRIPQKVRFNRSNFCLLATVADATSKNWANEKTIRVGRFMGWCNRWQVGTEKTNMARYSTPSALVRFFSMRVVQSKKSSYIRPYIVPTRKKPATF